MTGDLQEARLLYWCRSADTVSMETGLVTQEGDVRHLRSQRPFFLSNLLSLANFFQHFVVVQNSILWRRNFPEITYNTQSFTDGQENNRDCILDIPLQRLYDKHSGINFSHQYNSNPQKDSSCNIHINTFHPNEQLLWCSLNFFLPPSSHQWFIEDNFLFSRLYDVYYKFSLLLVNIEYFLFTESFTLNG